MRSPHTTTKSSTRSPQLEKAHAKQRTPNAGKNKSINLLKKNQKNQQNVWATLVQTLCLLSIIWDFNFPVGIYRLIFLMQDTCFKMLIN